MKKGFSILELMIVVAIIAFLAVISVPSLNRFLAKSKRAEAYMHLSSLYAAEKAYWAEHGRYTDKLSGPDSAGWQPEGYHGSGRGEKFYYTYGFPGSEGVNYFTGKLETPVSYMAHTYANEQGFLAYAVGYTYSKDKPDILTVDQNNNIVIVQDALN